MRILGAVLSLLVLFSCSRKFHKDYQVVDASSKDIPKWVDKPLEWAEDEDKEQFKKSRYYVYHSEPKNSREIACKIAEVRAREKVASEISVLIKNSFATVSEGDPNAKEDKLQEYVSDELTQQVQAQFVGSHVLANFWEKRKFLKEEGADEDRMAYVCSALVRIPKELLQKAFDRANKKLSSQTTDKKTKEKIQKVVEQAEQQYVQ